MGVMAIPVVFAVIVLGCIVIYFLGRPGPPK